MRFPVSDLGLAGLVVTRLRPSWRGVTGVCAEEVPGHLVAQVGGDLWGYLAGGREQADYYLGSAGTPPRRPLSCTASSGHGSAWTS